MSLGMSSDMGLDSYNTVKDETHTFDLSGGKTEQLPVVREKHSDFVYMRRTILSLFNLIHSNVPADCFLNVGEASLPPGWLLCACSEQIANHNEMGWSMGESQNHGCIIRPVYQTCKMAVRQCFSSGHTRYYSTNKSKSHVARKAFSSETAIQKKHPKNKTPMK